MTTTDELLQAVLHAPEARRLAALRLLKGEAPAPLPTPRIIEPFVTLKECGRRLGLSACALWRWQAPGHELGGRRKFRVSEVEAYLASEAFRARIVELQVRRDEARGTRMRDEG